jgi:hypothetical protein
MVQEGGTKVGQDRSLTLQKYDPPSHAVDYRNLDNTAALPQIEE